ncbi:MAG: recombination mediator RecR [Patescibacteria group bacterium]
MLSPSIQKLIDLFAKFPTVGPRTASRFVFYLIGQPKEKVKEMAQTLIDLKNNIKLCGLCFNPFENGDESVCPICADPSRDKKTLCVIEKESDLLSLEKTGQYKGLYFILGGAVSNLMPENIQKLRIEELKQRVEKGVFEEIILATNPTTDGQATSLYLRQILKPLAKKIVLLGRGLPLGGELEYADEETLSSAIENRK